MMLFHNRLKSKVLYDGPPRPSARVGDRRPRRTIVPFPQRRTLCPRRELAARLRKRLFALLPSALALLLSVASAEAQTGGREEFINRRQQILGAPLTTPEGLYLHSCAHCHSETGTGNGRLWATELSRELSLPGPADLTATQLNQAALVKFIAQGSAASGRPSSFCPPWGRTISPPDVERLARHILSLSGAAQPPAQEEETQVSESKTSPAGTPWRLLGVIVAEVGLLVWMVQRKKGPAHVVSKDPAVR